MHSCVFFPILCDFLLKAWECQDYAISIATIHHLSTHERRKAAVQRLIRAVCPTHGRILIYVWAIEQDELSKRSIPSAAPSSQDESLSSDSFSIGKDVFVPWKLTSGTLHGNSEYPRRRLEMSSGADSTIDENSPTHSRTRRTDFDRYYHMFDEGELRVLVKEAAAELGIDEWSGTDQTLLGSGTSGTFLEIMQDNWERSNFFIELRLLTI